MPVHRGDHQRLLCLEFGINSLLQLLPRSLLLEILGFGCFNLLPDLQLLILSQVIVEQPFKLLLGLRVGEKHTGTRQFQSAGTYCFSVLEGLECFDLGWPAIELFLLMLDLVGLGV